MKTRIRTVFLVVVSALIVTFGGGFAFGTDSLGGGHSAAARQPDHLEKLHQRMLPVFEIDGVIFTDADEQTNRLVVAVENRGLAKSVEQKLRHLDIPVDLVDIVVSDPIVPLVDTLRDEVRPLEGGLQIQFVKSPWIYTCTLGFNAELGSVQGFVVNSHCTGTQGTADDKTTYYQPTRSSVNTIGTETVDPSYSSVGGCPKGKKCRYSDSAFARRAAGVLANVGYIEKTKGPNTGSLNIVADSFKILREFEGNATLETKLNKVGRTTGWTQGNVTFSNINVGVQGTKIVLLGQDMVSAGVGSGDSGSPVFSIDDADGKVTLYGILWGGNGAGTNFVYSPLSNVKQELGVTTMAP